MTTCPQKITFDEMRASRVRYVCPDHRCSHRVEIGGVVPQGLSLTAPHGAAEKHIASWRIVILDSVAKMDPGRPESHGK